MDMTRHYHDLYGDESKDQKIKRLDAEIEQLREQRDLAVVTSIERAQEIERLREALSFYAKWGVVSPWVDKEINEDGGAKARSALQQKDSE